MYMLDTNTVSYFFRQEPTVVKKLQQLNPEVICISSVTAAELFYGVKKRNNQKLSDFLTTFYLRLRCWIGIIRQRKFMGNYGQIWNEKEKLWAFKIK